LSILTEGCLAISRRLHYVVQSTFVTGGNLGVVNKSA
jgi:hypothetical protein